MFRRTSRSLSAVLGDPGAICPMSHLKKVAAASPLKRVLFGVQPAGGAPAHRQATPEKNADKKREAVPCTFGLTCSLNYSLYFP